MCVVESRCGSNTRLGRNSCAHRQTCVGGRSHTHTHTRTRRDTRRKTQKAQEKTVTLYSLHVWEWVRVVMSIFKEMQQRTVISWGKKTKVYADGKSILPNNEFKFEICSFWLNASSVWSATETAEGVVTTGGFFWRSSCLGGEQKWPLILVLPSWRWHWKLTFWKPRVSGTEER